MKIDYALKRIKRLAERTKKQEPMLSYQTIYNLIKQPNPKDQHKKEQLFSLCLIAITNHYGKVNEAESIFLKYMQKPIDFLLAEIVNKISSLLPDFNLETDTQILDETIENCYYLINYQKHNRGTYTALYHLQEVVKYELDIEAFNLVVDYIKQKTKDLKNSKDPKIKMILIFLLHHQKPMSGFAFLTYAIKYQHVGSIPDYVDYKISQYWFKHLEANDFIDFCEKMRNNNDNSKAIKEVNYRENEIKRLNKLLWTI